MCFTHCTKTNIPECGAAEDCSFSCILRWFAHIKLCDTCLQHVTSNCNVSHCKKIIFLWHLRCNIIEFMITNDLQPSNAIFLSFVETLRQFFSFDYTQIKYNGSHKRTSDLFTFLNLFIQFVDEMSTLNMKITGMELDQCLNFIIRNELEYYFI